MALKGFIKAGYHTKIVTLAMDLEKQTIMFSVVTSTSEDGVAALPVLTFSLDRQNEIIKYQQENPPVFPLAPSYPVLCSDREAMVPMWTEESTQKEKDDYQAARDKYLSDLSKYEQDCAVIKASAISLSETANDYDLYFDKDKLFVNSNPVKCAYDFLKTRDSFAGVIDE
jgi:hypothetical protein